MVQWLAQLGSIFGVNLICAVYVNTLKDVCIISNIVCELDTTIRNVTCTCSIAICLLDCKDTGKLIKACECDQKFIPVGLLGLDGGREGDAFLLVTTSGAGGGASAVFWRENSQT